MPLELLIKKKLEIYDFTITIFTFYFNFMKVDKINTSPQLH